MYNSFERYWQNLKCGTISPKDFMKEMIREEYMPCAATWFNRLKWTIEEAVLIYHNWEPSRFQNIPWEIQKEFVEFIDQRYDIFGTLQSYIPSELFSNSNHLKIEKVINLFKQKNIKIPNHFPKYFAIDNDTDGVKDDDPCVAAIPLNKSIRRISLRKLVVRAAAKEHWKVEDENSKAYTKPSKLANTQKFKDLVQQLDSCLNLIPIGSKANNKSTNANDKTVSAVDPEWFSDLYPGDKKAGPRPKQKKFTP